MLLLLKRGLPDKKGYLKLIIITFIEDIVDESNSGF